MPTHGLHARPRHSIDNPDDAGLTDGRVLTHRWNSSGNWWRRSTWGEVSTYGDIASAAMLSSPRIVGWIMRTDSADLPWHRVITATGRPAAHLMSRQLELPTGRRDRPAMDGSTSPPRDIASHDRQA